jgi:hypothetical protein
MNERWLQGHRPPLETGRPGVFFVLSISSLADVPQRNQGSDRARVERHASAAFASLRQLGVEILADRRVGAVRKDGGPMPASAGADAAQMGPLQRLLARSRG